MKSYSQIQRCISGFTMLKQLDVKLWEERKVGSQRTRRVFGVEAAATCHRYLYQMTCV